MSRKLGLIGVLRALQRELESPVFPCPAMDEVTGGTCGCPITITFDTYSDGESIYSRQYVEVGAETPHCPHHNHLNDDGSALRELLAEYRERKRVLEWLNQRWPGKKR